MRKRSDFHFPRLILFLPTERGDKMKLERERESERERERERGREKVDEEK